MKRAFAFAALAMAAALNGCVGAGGESEMDETASASEESEVLGTAEQALQATDGPRMGGTGGSYFEQECGIHYGLSYVAIGTIQAATTSSPIVIRQIALICAPRSLVEAGASVPVDTQWIIWSSWRRNIALGYTQFVPAGQGPRIAFEPLNNAPGGIQTRCAPGYVLSGITGRAGALVDRISSVTCEWMPDSNAPGGHYIYSIQANVGGWGGTDQSSFCNRWEPGLGVIDQVTNGLHFRSGDVLDAMGFLCTE